jgi:hypothetical protein
MRELVHDGRRWQVREMAALHDPGARSDRCLVFDGESIVRRVWSYPDDWPQLSDTQLWALLDIRHSTPAEVRPRISGESAAERRFP